MRPRTKAINSIYHHFQEYVRNGMIMVYPIDTKKQLADMMTKPLVQNDFLPHRSAICQFQGASLLASSERECDNCSKSQDQGVLHVIPFAAIFVGQILVINDCPLRE